MAGHVRSGIRQMAYIQSFSGIFGLRASPGYRFAPLGTRTARFDETQVFG